MTDSINNTEKDDRNIHEIYSAGEFPERCKECGKFHAKGYCSGRKEMTQPDKLKIDEDALLAAAEVWHHVKMGKMALPWFETSLDWRTDCIKTARSLIEAYMTALKPYKPIENQPHEHIWDTSISGDRRCCTCGVSSKTTG